MSDSIKDLRVDIIEAESNIAALLTALAEKYEDTDFAIECFQYTTGDSTNDCVQVDITASIRIS